MPPLASLLFLLFMAISSIPAQAFYVHISPAPTGGKITKRTGDNLMVICHVRDLDNKPEKITIQWYRDNEVISGSGRITAYQRSYLNQLLFVTPATADSGPYKCVVSVDGVEQTAETTITFIEAARFVNPQLEQHPEEGTDAKIVCDVEGDDSLEIFWQFQGDNIHEESPRGYEFNDRGMLVIPHYSAAQDDGVYTCNAALFSTFESLSINVTGYAKPEITVCNGPNGNRALEGHPARFECQATGKPKPSYVWLHEKDGAATELKSSDKYTLHDGLLIIESVSLLDGGEYVCVATNDLREARRSVAISIFQKPRVEHIGDTTIQQGHLMELTCRYSGDGTINVTWFFDEQPIPATQVQHDNIHDSSSDEDGSDDDYAGRMRRQPSHKMVEHIEGGLKLRIGAATQADAGKYTCVAENEAGKAQESTTLLITHGPYMISKSGDNIRSFEGNTVVLFCEVSAIPPPTWSWTLDDEEISANGHSIAFEHQPTSSHLRVQTSSASDFGKYKCAAENDYGKIESTPMVVQQIFPPAVPADIDCSGKTFPNYAKCVVGGYRSANFDHLPTKLFVRYALEEEASSEEFSWEEDSTLAEIPYDLEFEINGLLPSKKYVLRVQASNEAGASQFSAAVEIETTDPWRPAKISAVTIDCGVPCIVSWAPANDHGSKVTTYRLTLRKVDRDSGEATGTKTVLEVDGADSKIDLSGLKSHSKYELSLVSENDVGESEPMISHFETSDLSQGSSILTNAKTFTLFVACGLTIVVILLLVDLSCYCTNRCGLLACFCANCLGRSGGNQKSRDIERANRGESNRLLEDAKPDGVTIRGNVRGPSSTSV
ncbi:hypothetical protein L596_003545 [Steinernema carpocapsae]|uniref:Uncharacterized protein n=1 Tax=Steinernema carpocapsae TaxID=34508 RepID=A0A4U8UT17_STECR|nr:hypothetical protein L596_003545 [Steinernema carpocapsae]